MLKNINLVDRIKVPSERKLTDAGQMLVPCKFARTGTQLYTAKQLGLVDRKETDIIIVHREVADVFNGEAMESFRSAPVTLGHPKDADGKSIPVDSTNAKDLQVGMLEGMPVRDEETLGGTLVLTAQEAIDALEEGTQELSAGYLCDIEDVDGTYFQRNIRANHIAIVAKGRAGSSCRISDEAMEGITDEDLEDILSEDGAIEAKVAKLKEERAAKNKKPKSKGKAKAEDKSDEEGKSDLTDELASLTDQLAVQVQLVDELTEDVKTLTVDLADAKLAAEQSVTARCAAIENARLISDFRDLGDKSIEQIERMVVEDQMPEKDLSGKSAVFISAMFEILVDASQGETPMGKLLRKVETTDSPIVKKIDKVAAARQAAIARSKKQA